MQILSNTDKNIPGNERFHAYLEEKLTTSLHRFSNRITRVEAHLGDENGQRNSDDDKRCLLEAHLVGHQPVVVTAHAAEVEQSINAAIAKLKAALDTVVGKLTDHYR
ncbi:HPF/RaiA family ribosome-associated protein [Pedobacter sp. HMF7056]|uniref:HPF/RaiA family ribosome-associated protein n=2 Tax=Hufsiella ginkgonis TaxID=2695274 RepID=A0A7K1XUX9_9SPHI|nr:HPF/RaiA family ribosome-associated protein [Hufsiella ginkgonis]